MIPTLQYIENGVVFVSWIALGWIFGAIITAVAIKSLNNK